MFESMQRGIQRALLHLQHFARKLADAARDRPAMLRLELKRFEDQKIERALNEVDGFDRQVPLIIDSSIRGLMSIIKGTATRLVAWSTFERLVRLGAGFVVDDDALRAQRLIDALGGAANARRGGRCHDRDGIGRKKCFDQSIAASLATNQIPGGKIELVRFVLTERLLERPVAQVE